MFWIYGKLHKVRTEAVISFVIDFLPFPFWNKIELKEQIEIDQSSVVNDIFIKITEFLKGNKSYLI